MTERSKGSVKSKEEIEKDVLEELKRREQRIREELKYQEMMSNNELLDFE